MQGAADSQEPRNCLTDRFPARKGVFVFIDDSEVAPRADRPFGSRMLHLNGRLRVNDGQRFPPWPTPRTSAGSAGPVPTPLLLAATGGRVEVHSSIHLVDARTGVMCIRGRLLWFPDLVH